MLLAVPASEWFKKEFGRDFEIVVAVWDAGKRTGPCWVDSNTFEYVGEPEYWMPVPEVPSLPENS